MKLFENGTMKKLANKKDKHCKRHQQIINHNKQLLKKLIEIQFLKKNPNKKELIELYLSL